MIKLKKILILNLSILLISGCSYTPQPTVNTEKNVIINYNEDPSTSELKESSAYLIKVIGTLLFIGGLYALSNKYDPQNNN